MMSIEGKEHNRRDVIWFMMYSHISGVFARSPDGAAGVARQKTLLCVCCSAVQYHPHRLSRSIPMRCGCVG